MIDSPLRPVQDADELAAEVRRVAGALLDEAIRLAEGPDGSCEDERVHEVRKRVKEVRSLLRLVRFSLVDGSGNRVRGRENGACKLAANQLGGARDAAVMVQSLDRLKSLFADKLAADAFAGLRRGLAARHRAVKKEGIRFGEAAAILQAVRGRVEDWRLDAGKKGRAWDSLSPGLHKIYGDGRGDLKDARGGGEADLWHDWRKRVKDLRYAAELLRESAPALLGGLIDAANALGDNLGEDHDLAVLLGTVRGDPSLCDDATATTLAALATRRSGELRAQAERDAGRVYAEPPKAFVRRARAYWRASCP